MPSQVTCPGCGAAYKVPDGISRRTIRCRTCQTPFEVGDDPQSLSLPVAIAPHPMASGSSEGTVAIDSAPVAEPAGPGRLMRIKSLSRAWMIALAGGGAALLLFCCIGGVGIFWMFGGGRSLLSRSGEDPNLPPIDTTDIEPVPIPANHSGELSPEVRTRLKQATVFIKVTLPNGQQGSGSGFFGGKPDIVLTNAHVVGMLESDTRKPDKIEIVLNSGEKNQQTMPAEVLGVDRRTDLALLRPRPTPDQVKWLPDPLPVKTATRLFETQRLFVVGFPLGDALGKEITFSNSTVGSLRKDENGELKRIQVNGGIHSGNSGGPIIDLVGNVVGLAVSRIRGTTINFVIPGDQVHHLLYGRIEGISVDHPYTEGGKTRAQVTLYKHDPLNRLRQAAVMVWSGPPGAARPGGSAQPARQDGDSSPQKIVLGTRDEKGYRGDVTLPAIPPGQVCWIQPYWVNGRGQTTWGEGKHHDVDDPVERKPAQLVLRHQVGQRPLALSRKTTMKVPGSGTQDKLVVVSMDTDFQENTRSVDPQGTAEIRLEYRSCKIQANLDNQPLPPDKSARLERISQAMTGAAGIQRVDRNNVTTLNQIDLSRVPFLLRADVIKMHDDMRQGLDALAVPMPPDPNCQPLTTWSRSRILPITTLGVTERASMDMTYTYLGIRTRKGRQEAVIGMKGQLRGPQDDQVSIVGRADGQAIFDIAAGQFSTSELRTVVDMDLRLIDLEGAVTVKASGTTEDRLRRVVTGN